MPWDDSGLWDDAGTWQDGEALSPNDPNPGTIMISAHTVSRAGMVSVDFSHGDIVVDTNHKLKHTDGTPFIPISDTCWPLLRNLSHADLDTYLEDRRNKGFTCITTRGVCVDYLDLATQEPDFYGNIQFTGDDLGSPNENYFANLDYIIDAAASRGIFVNLVVWRGANPAWNAGGSNPTNMYALGLYLGTRYADRSNIFWKLGFDTPMTTLGVANWQAMAAGLDDGCGGKFVTEYHFNPGTQVKDACFEVVGTQTGHGPIDNSDFWSSWGPTAWAAPYPVWNVEPCYENHPVSGNPAVRFTGTDVRTQAYWTILSGGLGTGYGDFAVMELYRPGDESYMSASYGGALPSDYWYNSLDYPGATSMALLRELLDSRPFLDLVPDQTLVTNASSGATHLACARGADYAYVYSPFGYGFTVNMGKISGSEVFAFWFNPRDGETLFVGRYTNSGTQAFEPPGDARGEDHVLILDDVDAGYLIVQVEDFTTIDAGALTLSGSNIGASLFGSLLRLLLRLFQ